MRALRRPTVRFGIITAAMCAALWLLVHFGLRLRPFAAWLVAVNLATFCCYAYDKRIAGGTWWRVPEVVLHGLATAGGSPAALFAQWLLRHKTVKPAFQRVFWTIVGAQLALAGLYVWYRS